MSPENPENSLEKPLEERYTSASADSPEDAPTPVEGAPDPAADSDRGYPRTGSARKTLLKGLIGLFWLIFVIGLIPIPFLVLYTEWLCIREGFWDYINPIVYLLAPLALLEMPLFWISVGTAVAGYLGYAGFSKLLEKK